MTMPITSTTLLSDAKMVFAETHVLLQQNLSAFSFRDHAWRLLESTDDDISLRGICLQAISLLKSLECRIVLSAINYLLCNPKLREAHIHDDEQSMLLCQKFQWCFHQP